jgi:hypothetical protein
MAESLDDAIRRLVVPAFNSRGDFTLTLWAGHVANIARDTGIPGWSVEARAIDLGLIPTRYLRNMHSITPEAQARLLRSSVAQVGLGGLGGTILDQLLRLGVGTLRVADGDTFEDSNLNRQTLCDMAAIGRSKAEAARHAAARINPSATVDTRHEFLTRDTLPRNPSAARHTLSTSWPRSWLPRLPGCCGAMPPPVWPGACWSLTWIT